MRNGVKRALLLSVCAASLLVGCGEVVVPTPSATQPPPTPPPTMVPSPEVTLTAPPSATTEATATQTPRPAATPTASPTALTEQVLVRETTLSILSYVYESYLEEGLDEDHGVRYLWLDRAAYEQPSPEFAVLTPFKAVVLENRYLTLTILPELGGRLYQCAFKPTGQTIFYQNRVLKPTGWGPLSRERNWWLAAGGLEWAFPVSEHGYEWGVPWSYSIERSGAEVKVVLWATEEARLRSRVEIALSPNRAYFEVRPRAENPTDSSVSVQFWTNAMLSLGSHSLSPNTEFVLPTDEILIHSAGPDSGLPGERFLIAWPVWEGRDLSLYESWQDWLGLFVPELSHEFTGAYNYDTDLGVVRAFSREQAPGVKLFAWGLGSPYGAEYADDGSQYFEMWGGLNRSFWPEDDVVLQPGESSGWTEYWYPFVGIEGLDFANREAALSLQYAGDSLQVGLATSTPREGILVLQIEGEEAYREQVRVSPESPYLAAAAVRSGITTDRNISINFLTLAGEVIASYEAPPSALVR
jgi:hypothetical protein